MVLALLENVPETTDVQMVFLQDGPLTESVAALGVDTVVIDSGRARDPLRQLRAFKKLRALARSSDVAFSHVAKSQALAGWAARAARTRSVWYQHELPGQPQTLQKIAAASRPGLTIANSEFVAAKHRQLWPSADVSVVHPGILAPDQGECRTHASGSGATVAVLSRLDRWKRVELSIDAFAAAQKTDPSLRLVVIGGEAGGQKNAGYLSELKRRAADSTVADSVEFTGAVPNARRRLNEVDVLIQLSEGEPFGLSVAEALSYEVPAIVSNDGGAVEIIEDGRSGFAVDAEATSAVAERLLRLTSDATLRTGFGKAGRERVLTSFDRRTQSAEMWRQVHAVTSEKRG